MGIDVVPPLGPAEQQVVTIGLARAGMRLDGVHVAYASAWRRAAAREAVDSTPPAPARYAPSPRSTRGATRA